MTTQTEIRNKSMAIGREPYGKTQPPIYLCGHCRAVEIGYGEGVCEMCEQTIKNATAERQTDWIILGLAVCATGIVFLLLMAAARWGSVSH